MFVYHVMYYTPCTLYHIRYTILGSLCLGGLVGPRQPSHPLARLAARAEVLSPLPVVVHAIVLGCVQKQTKLPQYKVCRASISQISLGVYTS